MHAHTHTHVCVHTCAHKCTRAHVYACTHTHIQVAWLLSLARLPCRRYLYAYAWHPRTCNDCLFGRLSSFLRLQTPMFVCSIHPSSMLHICCIYAACPSRLLYAACMLHACCMCVARVLPVCCMYAIECMLHGCRDANVVCVTQIIPTICRWPLEGGSLSLHPA